MTNKEPRIWMTELRESEGMTLIQAATLAAVSLDLLMWLEAGTDITTRRCAREIALVYGMTPAQEAEIGRAGLPVGRRRVRSKRQSARNNTVYANKNAVMDLMPAGGMSFGKFARSLGISPTTLGRIKQEVPKPVSTDTVTKIALAAGRPVEEFIDRSYG